MAGIGGAPRVRVGRPQHGAHRQAERGKERCQLRGVACHEVVVRRHHMHRHTGQARHRGGERGRVGLAFAGRHLGEVVVEQNAGGQQLAVERVAAERAPARIGNAAQRLGAPFTGPAVARQAGTQTDQAIAALRLIKAVPRRLLCTRRLQQPGALRV